MIDARRPPENVEKNELTHYPRCCPGSKNVFGSLFFGSADFGVHEGQY